MLNQIKNAVVRNEDYSIGVGARKATGNGLANLTISAPVGAFIITMMRYNGVDWWPIEADATAAAVIVALLTGIIRLVGDWVQLNVHDVRYKREQEEQQP